MTDKANFSDQRQAVSRSIALLILGAADDARDAILLATQVLVNMGDLVQDIRDEHGPETTRGLDGEDVLDHIQFNLNEILDADESESDQPESTTSDEDDSGSDDDKPTADEIEETLTFARFMVKVARACGDDKRADEGERLISKVEREIERRSN